jgi:hypothetical protein
MIPYYSGFDLERITYVIKFVSDLRQVDRWFSLGATVSSTNKTGRHNINEILLKVALNTITLTLFYSGFGLDRIHYMLVSFSISTRFAFCFCFCFVTMEII